MLGTTGKITKFYRRVKVEQDPICFVERPSAGKWKTKANKQYPTSSSERHEIKIMCINITWPRRFSFVGGQRCSFVKIKKKREGTFLDQVFEIHNS